MMGAGGGVKPARAGAKRASVSAGGTASSTMCACGAIEYAHSMSSVASPDQPAAPADPDFPLPLEFEKPVGPWTICSNDGLGSPGKNVSWKVCRSCAAVGR
jgi:hypothetical protein